MRVPCIPEVWSVWCGKAGTHRHRFSDPAGLFAKPLRPFVLNDRYFCEPDGTLVVVGGTVVVVVGGTVVVVVVGGGLVVVVVVGGTVVVVGLVVGGTVVEDDVVVVFGAFEGFEELELETISTTIKAISTTTTTPISHGHQFRFLSSSPVPPVGGGVPGGTRPPVVPAAAPTIGMALVASPPTDGTAVVA